MPIVATQPIASILTDRWGEVHRTDLGIAELEAVDRLHDVIGTCEMAFVARAADGEFGILVEQEYLWPESDADEDVVSAWGESISDVEALKRVLGYAAGIAEGTANVKRECQVAVVPGGDHVTLGRIGLHVFIPEGVVSNDTVDEVVKLMFAAELQTLLC